MNRKCNNKLIIALSYGFISLNCLIAWASKLLKMSSSNPQVGILGIVMAMLVLLSIVDTREEMSSSFAVWSSIIAEFSVNCFISIAYSFYWLLVLTIPETILLIVLSIRIKKN